MYEAVSIDPDADEALARVCETAATYGFDGVVIRNGATGSIRERVSTRDDDIDVVSGVEIRAESAEQASGAVGNHRPDYTILMVAGGTPSMNRFAVESEKVDVLTRPMTDDGDVNHVLAKAAADNGVRIEFDLGPVLRTSGGRRVRALQDMRKLYEIVSYYDAPYVVSGHPTTELELRAPRELAALGAEIGLPASWIEDGLAEWGRLATRNRHVQSESFIEPGVERGRYETDR